MADNIDECAIDFDQLESEHKRILEKVKLEKALAAAEEKKDVQEEPKQEKDMIKLTVEPSPADKVRSHWTNTHLVPRWDPNDTSTWNSSSQRVEDDSVTFDQFDEMSYDPYDIGSGNGNSATLKFEDWSKGKHSKPTLANTPDFNEWEAHAWPEDDSSDDPAQEMDIVMSGNATFGTAPKDEVWDTSQQKWVKKDKRPLTKHYQEQEEEDMMSVVYQSAEEIKYCVDNLTQNVENLESEVQEISTTATFISNNVSGLESKMKRLEYEVKQTRQEMKYVRDLLEIIVKYYTEESSQEDKDMT